MRYFGKLFEVSSLALKHEHNVNPIFNFQCTKQTRTPRPTSINQCVSAHNSNMDRTWRTWMLCAFDSATCFWNMRIEQASWWSCRDASVVLLMLSNITLNCVCSLSWESTISVELWIKCNLTLNQKTTRWIFPPGAFYDFSKNMYQHSKNEFMW